MPTFEAQIRELPTQPPQGYTRHRTEWMCESIPKDRAVDLAREADAALAARQRENISIKEVMVEQARKIERLTDLNTAKVELIEFYDRYISGLNGYLHAHNMAPSQADIETGERLRAKIEELSR